MKKSSLTIVIEEINLMIKTKEEQIAQLEELRSSLIARNEKRPVRKIKKVDLGAAAE